MVTETKEIALTKEKSMEMKMYEEEKQAQCKAFVALGDAIGQGTVKKGLDLTVMIARCKSFLDGLSKENQEEANREYLERCEESEGKPFAFNGFKFSRNADSTKITFIGEVGKEIKELESKAKVFNDKIAVLKKGAKANGTNIRKSVTPAIVKYKVAQIAPKVKPAC